MGKIGQWENAEPGVKRNIINAGNELMMMEVHFEKNAQGYEHSHVHEQMSYCLLGKMAFYIDGVETILKKGDSIFIPSNAKHSVTALEASAILDVFTPIREDLLDRE
ncbi:cupin domain-containing protein [Bacillus sp. FJAT-50079]|uniref:cupin domain-containing protein n=1 Tax=Bacillus sp. FJAT-50079 TaxID=2833577 RepID=UPI001BC98BE7|nr:cupin domain-containing protein [Bacillus sp. FJAT-50079]MBS4207838.1 cupin domain-containing protein [Bacillus sp. FJAT-50079]